MADPNPEVKGVLIELRDINKEKRRTAVMKLGMLGGDDAIRALIRTVENDFEDLIVRGRAALMLGKLGDTRAVTPLIKALEAPGYQIPLHAAQALGQLRDPRAIAPLMALAGHSKDRLHDAVMLALRQLGAEVSLKPEAAFRVAEPEPGL